MLLNNLLSLTASNETAPPIKVWNVRNEQDSICTYRFICTIIILAANLSRTVAK